MKKNILFVSEYYHPKIGGGETWLQELAEELVCRGHTVHVITSRLPRTKASEKINGVYVKRVFPSGGIIQKIKFIRFLRTHLPQYIKKNDISLVHNLANIPTIPSTFAAKECGIPVMTSIHLSLASTWFRVTNPFSAMMNWLGEIIIFYFSPHDKVHVTAKTTANRVKKLVKAPVDTIYNSLPQKNFREAFRQLNVAKTRKKYGVRGKCFLFVGSLLPVKNVQNMVREFLKADGTLLVVGDGPERSALEKIVKKNNAEKKIQLLGKVSEKEKLSLLGSCDALLLLSHSEQSPLTVLEALAFNKPVIATRVGGVPDIYEKGFDIRFINTVAELPKATKKIVAKKKKSLNEKLFAEFAIKKMVDAFEKNYSVLLSSRVRRKPSSKE